MRVFDLGPATFQGLEIPPVGDATFFSVSITPTLYTADVGLSIFQRGALGDAGLDPAYAMNRVLVAEDTIDRGGNTNDAFTVFHHFGGVGTKGGRQVVSAYGYLQHPTDAGNTNRNYVASFGSMYADSDDGGTDTGAGAKGACFGSNFQAVARDGAVNLLEVSAGEHNVACNTGSSVKYKNIFSLAARPDDVVQGSVYDCMLAFSNQTGAVGFQDGVLFGPMNGVFPITTTGTVFRTIGGSFKRAIDFSTSTFSEDLLKGPGGFSISALGVLQGQSYQLGGDINHGRLQLGTAIAGRTPYVKFLGTGSNFVQLIQPSDNVFQVRTTNGTVFEVSDDGVKFGTKTLASVIPDGYIMIKDSVGNTVKLVTAI